MRFEHRYRVFAVCVLGIFTSVFDTSAAIVALPTIAADFDTVLPTVQWVIVGNSVTVAALLVPMGRLSDLVGRRRVHVLGCCLFTGGAAGAALAGSVTALILARVLVGVGAAMTQGTAMAIIAGHFDTRERARMFGLQTGAVGLGAIAGPATGGLIVGTSGWRMLFAVTCAVMLMIAVSAYRVLDRPATRPEETRPAFDLAGAVLFSGALVAGLLTLTLGPDQGWAAPATVTGAAACVALLAAFVLVERRQPAPMLDLGLFRNSAFALGALGVVVAFMGLSSMRFLTPFFLQGVKGFEPAHVGLLLMPAAVVTAVVSPFAGRLAEHVGMRRLANAGFGVAILGLLVFARLATETPTWVVVGGLMVIALGMATFSAPNSASVLNSVDESGYGVAAAFINLSRNLGNVIGVAFGTAVVTLSMASAGFEPSLSAVETTGERDAFAAFTAGVNLACTGLIGLAAVVLVLLVVNGGRGRAA